MKAWIAIASANHVAKGREGGFMQVCHGKSSPLARTSPGDMVIYYSPSSEMRGGERVQAFTAAGVITERSIYQYDMGENFTPWRRDVHWFTTQPAPIHPLLDCLEFTRGKRNWGYQFRFGIFAISDHDCRKILISMGIG
ncbi:EVE domain-containing protein [Rhizobium sp. L1K21]|uniref:EVE domain-containing protein n=1 Tax=Rhizobium sp. L1K21 TaxID=2954933 RepID=UPI002092B9BB|nr:EVE domain-containing protein [Rhizobium sp. L1K21]MCO6184956.1 EVE domain-containing protein [Rhizobium sp. L1K21]